MDKAIKRMDTNQYLLYGSPPTASDGPDLYIQKLFAQGGIDPGDSFKPANPNQGSHSGHGSTLNTIVKWAGIAFAGVLAALGLQKFGPAILKWFKG